MSEAGPRMLRMVRWQSLMQDADRLRSWRDQDEVESLARCIHMGDARTARLALLDWAKEEHRRLQQDPASVPHDYGRLRRVYLEMRSKIDGRIGVMDTELGFWSQNVGPEYDRAVYEYPTWTNTANLRHLFSEGREVVITGHMGSGKSHLAVSLMEYLLESFKRPTVHVVTNIPGIKDTSGRFDRIHHVSLLSEILWIWARLPAGCLIALFLDEPETNLRGGSTKSVRLFNDFRHMIRKLGMSKLEIWHTQGEQYKALREEKSEHVTRIMKTEKETFEVHRVMRGNDFKQVVEGVHELRFLRYAHRGMASIDVDVNMTRLIGAIGKLYRVEDIKKAVMAALGNPAFYLPEHRARDSAAQGAVSRSNVAAHVLKYVRPFLTRQRSIDYQRLRAVFNLPYRESRELARELTMRWRKSTPDWQSVTPSHQQRLPAKKRARDEVEADGEE